MPHVVSPVQRFRSTGRVDRKVKRKTVAIECAAAAAGQLAAIVRCYAQAAYPEGGSECAQAARETLIDVATQCESHPGGVLSLRRKLLPQLRAAVRWYLSEHHIPPAASLQDLEALLDRKVRDA